MFSLDKTETLPGMHRNTALENFASENLYASVVPKASGRFLDPVPEFL